MLVANWSLCDGFNRQISSSLCIITVFRSCQLCMIEIVLSGLIFWEVIESYIHRGKKNQ